MTSLTTRREFLRVSLAAATTGGVTAAKTAAEPPVVFLKPTDVGYASARQTYNSTLVERPAIIARCASEAGVQAAVAHATEAQMAVAVKSGGHSFEGFCLNAGGLVADVSLMKSLALDPKSGVLTAGPGCRLADVNGFLLKRRRLLPSGSCAGVGLAGLTLGGGYGLFARKFGLTCDHLLGVRLVDGMGQMRDSRDEPELLWACRGGGNGHFGVVTELRLQTRTAPTQLAAFKCRAAKLDESRATRLLGVWFAASAELPRDAFSAFVLNGNFLSILLTTTGSPQQKGVQAFLKSLRAVTDTHTSARPVGLTQALPWYDGEPGPVAFKNASAGYYRSFADIAPALPGVLAEVLHVPGLIFQVNTLGGAIADGPDGAYPHRDWAYLGEWQSYWEHPSQRDSLVAATSRIRGHLAAGGIARHYANYPDKGFEDWSTAYYGNANYARLQTLKRHLDPDNRVRHPQSVRA